jgi:hypothetical protein
MKQQPPLQITIFFILVILAVAGTILEQNSLPLREDLAPQKTTTADTVESQKLKDDATLAALSKENKTTTDVQGEISRIHQDTVTTGTNEKFSLASNTLVSRNGVDTTLSSLKPDDFFWATSKDGQKVLRISAVSRNMAYAFFAVAALIIGSLLFLLGRFLKRNGETIKHKLFPHHSLSLFS